MNKHLRIVPVAGNSEIIRPSESEADPKKAMLETVIVKEESARFDKAFASSGSSLGAELESLRPRLQQLVRLRLDPRLRRRVDSGDVVQEAYIDIVRRIDRYRSDPRIPFFLWARLEVAQKLTEVHRRHLGAGIRDVRREAQGRGDPQATSISLARALVDRRASPTKEVALSELEEQLKTRLEEMKPIDREIILLRHFEQLSNAECAQVLDLTVSGAKVRYIRAIKRLRDILTKTGIHKDIELGGLGDRS